MEASPFPLEMVHMTRTLGYRKYLNFMLRRTADLAREHIRGVPAVDLNEHSVVADCPCGCAFLQIKIWCQTMVDDDKVSINATESRGKMRSGILVKLPTGLLGNKLPPALLMLKNRAEACSTCKWWRLVWPQTSIGFWWRRRMGQPSRSTRVPAGLRNVREFAVGLQNGAIEVEGAASSTTNQHATLTEGDHAASSQLGGSARQITPRGCGVSCRRRGCHLAERDPRRNSV